jgi:hypothetical protein
VIVFCSARGCIYEASIMLDTGALCPVPGTEYGVQLVRTIRPVCVAHLASEVQKGWPFEVLVAPV